MSSTMTTLDGMPRPGMDDVTCMIVECCMFIIRIYSPISYVNIYMYWRTEAHCEHNVMDAKTPGYHIRDIRGT